MTEKSREQVFKIGTRGSQLALWQAKEVAKLLSAIKVKTEIVIIKTSGDRFQNIPLQGQSQVGFFTKEIENQLISQHIDIAVHSLKDLPTQPHSDLILAAYLSRAEISDLLLVHPHWHEPDALVPVKSGCQVGATSLRRQALLRLYGSQANPTMLRGNVPTRVQKCLDEQYGAIIVARAGVERLNLDLSPLIVYELNPKIWLPAPGQGVIAVQVRRNHHLLINHVKKLNHPASHEATEIERQLLANFEGGCHTAFGALALKVDDNKNLWNTTIGMEIFQKGWRQYQFEHLSKETFGGMKGDDIPEWTTIKIDQKEELCRLIQR